VKNQDQKIEKINAMNAILLHEPNLAKKQKNFGGLKAEKITGIDIWHSLLILARNGVWFGLYGSGLSGKLFPDFLSEAYFWSM